MLAPVPPEDVRALFAVARRRTFRRGEVAFHGGQPADTVHFIASGRFAVRVLTPLGDEVTLAIRVPGEAFGELALVLQHGRRTATVAALEQAETRSVLKGDFDALRKRHPAVNDVLAILLAETVQQTTARLVEVLFVPAEARVRRRISELAAIYGGTVPFPQTEIAALAGTSRATANRVLREEEQRGTLQLRRGTTVVIDEEAIRERAR